MKASVTYSPEIVAAICERLAAGESLRAICRDDGMPTEGAFRLWEREIEEVSTQSLRAREIGCHTMADECLEIADDGRNDWMERPENKGGGWDANGEHIQRSRLRIDTRMRLLGKWLPKVYGDKLELAGNKESPLVVQVLKLSDADDSTPGK